MSVLSGQQLLKLITDQERQRRRNQEQRRRTGGPHANRKRAVNRPGKGHRRDWKKEEHQ